MTPRPDPVYATRDALAELVLPLAAHIGELRRRVGELEHELAERAAKITPPSNPTTPRRSTR